MALGADPAPKGPRRGLVAIVVSVAAVLVVAMLVVLAVVLLKSDDEVVSPPETTTTTTTQDQTERRPETDQPTIDPSDMFDRTDGPWDRTRQPTRDPIFTPRTPTVPTTPVVPRPTTPRWTPGH